MKHFGDKLNLGAKGVLMQNRMAVAAMTNRQSNPDGSLAQEEYDWLVARAKGGFAMVTTCAAHISLDGQGWAGALGVYDDELLPGMTRLAKGLGDAGALGIVQLFHGGVRAPSSVTGMQPWSATEFTLNSPNFEAPRQGSIEEIEATIEAFATAAERCERAGFAGVELHGAHGYLLCQFLGKITNTRSDGWGGDSFESRARLIRETLRAVKARVSDSFIVGVRISAEVPDMGVDLDESETLVRWLADDGADFVHVSLWDSFAASKKYPEDKEPLTTRFRRALPKECPLIIAGGLWSTDDVQTILEQGADVVALGRAAIGNPAWPTKALNPAWSPAKPPYTEEQLRERHLSAAFVDYMRRWPNFVVDNSES